MSSLKECRIGLLGAARITPPAIILPARDNEAAIVDVVAARDTARAKIFAREHVIPRVADSYQALIEDPDIDLVYNALPASEHLPWTLKALSAGKHVLCEKPISLNAIEAQEIVDLAEAKDCLMIEAFHYRYHPVIHRVLELLQSQVIGQVESIEAVFNVSIADTSDIRYQKLLGGGALMDLGCYPVHWLRTCMGEEPEVTTASATVTETDVDISLSGELLFPSGTKGQVSCSMAAGSEMKAELKIQGSAGSLRVVNPLAPHHGYKITLKSDNQFEGEAQDIKVVGRSTYHHQLDAVIELINGQGLQITGGQDCVNNMVVIDALYRAAGVSAFKR